MSLFDYAGSQLGWHPDWPEARPSVSPVPPAPTSLAAILSQASYPARRIAPLPPLHVNYCGGCFRRFVATNAKAAANALRQHIEAEPCPSYAARTGAEMPHHEQHLSEQVSTRTDFGPMSAFWA